ncbi:MAG: MBL fold metallo-hydrolase [Cryomorphaceae bacterium]|nr:MBL fold metallo-hydrolase [Flavobacteriales bacterium]
MIEVRKFTFNPFQENTYVIANEKKNCFIVDPGCYDRREQALLKQFIASEGLKPVGLLNTHCHIDHVFGNKFASETYGLSPVIHPIEEAMLAAVPRVAELYNLDYDPSPDAVFYEGDEIFLDDEKFEILFTPGHSPGHIVLYHAASKTLIAGDVLFRKSIGRTDLPGGDHDTLIESIKEKVFALPDDTKVYPGHMEETEIGYEKKHNPFLA